MSNRLIFIIILISAIVAALLYVVDRSLSGTENEPGVSTPSEAYRNGFAADAAKGDRKSNFTGAENGVTSIANKWQWSDQGQAARANSRSIDIAPLPFTAQSVYDALQAVMVDENGNVVMDHAALISLDEALERIYNRLDSESLLTLQELIEEALPGKTGEQTASLVGNYHQYLQAKEQFDQIHAVSPSFDSPQSVATIEGDQRLYSQLQTLREVHLGPVAAQNLFHDSDANAEFMFESIKLGLDGSLNQDEVAARQQEIELRRRQQLGLPSESHSDHSMDASLKTGSDSESTGNQ